jgi:hypothetical protein
MTKLVLVRHGGSTLNRENRFTGWTDIELSEKGREEAREAVLKITALGDTFQISLARLDPSFCAPPDFFNPFDLTDEAVGHRPAL